MTRESEKIWNMLDDHSNRLTAIEASMRGTIREEVTEAVRPLVAQLVDHDKRLTILEERARKKNGSFFSDPGKFWRYVIIALLFIIAALVGTKLPGLGLMIISGAAVSLLTSGTGGSDTPLLTSGSMEGATNVHFWDPPPPMQTRMVIPPQNRGKRPKKITDEDRPTLRKSIRTFLSTFREAHAFQVGIALGLLIYLAHPGVLYVVIPLLILGAMIAFWEEVHYFIIPLAGTVIGLYLLEVVGWIG